MPSLTTNYNLSKPTIGAEADNWGQLLNADLDTIDSTMKSISDAAGAAATVASAALPKVGGTMTGLLTTAANGLVSASGVTGSVAENTLTTLFDPGAVAGVWIVNAWRTDVGDHISMAIFYAINSSGVSCNLAVQYNSGAGSNDVTFGPSTSSGIQAKRNSGAGTGTISWRATRIIGA